jgi:uncharacterized protein
MTNLLAQIAQELTVNTWQVEKAVQLLDEGATVPFISRYRKEVTGSLSDSQLRQLNDRLGYLRELEDRRTTILKSIKDQGKLTPALEKQIGASTTKNQLEDLYLPYKPKRRTKGQIAHERGLTPLADLLLSDKETAPETLAEKFIDTDKEVPDAKAALDGARAILMERFAEQAELREKLREYVWSHGELVTQVIKDKEAEGEKFRDYFEYSEAISKVPSHRALAIFRGRKAGVLRANIQINQPDTGFNAGENFIAEFFSINERDQWLAETVCWAWKIKFMSFLDVDLFCRLREQAEEEAFQVFAKNLKNVLLAAPAGQRCTLGLDPGFRTGVKAVVVNSVGKLVANTTIFPHKPQQQWAKSLAVLKQLCEKHQVDLVSIGNGTASRETDELVAELCKENPQLKLTKIVTSEAGASVYSASEIAEKEFPDLDVTYRGAVSIARRLQDPLAELVKVDPKSIGVGQYQHDVNQFKLARTLSAVVEDCVNAVGVEVNSASAPLLTHVSGLSSSLAENIVRFREERGAFASREALKEVPLMGAKTFEQAAGFLRVSNGENPLDASAVHPESYPIVEEILQKVKQPLKNLMGDQKALEKINAQQFVTDQFGLLTIKDIIKELEKPGRDPRPEFKTAEFNQAVHEIRDLKEGMVLEGVVTNVANFGAFVDIGVHQDGLVHVSKLANRFVSNPHDVVKTGDIVKVKVEEVDEKRKRISLTMRLTEQGEKRSAPQGKKKQAQKKPAPKTAMAEAFAQLLQN